MRVLVTRPEADAAPLVAALKARGVDSVVAPLLDIVFTETRLDLDGVQALLFTSANGVRAFARTEGRRALPAYAVGDATARAARAAGFAEVASAAGDVDDLAALVQGRLDPQAGRLLHVAGSSVAGDLAGMLEDSGFAIDRAVLYRAAPVAVLPAAARDALAAGALDGVLLFSPRTAESFVRLVQSGELANATRTLHAYCLSDAVEAAARGLDWAGLQVARAPTQDALIDLVVAPGAAVSDQPANAAQRIVQAFGGIRPMASKLGIAVTTVQGWKERGAIPAARRTEIEKAAAANGIALDAADLDAMSGADAAKVHAATPPAAATTAAAATSAAKPASAGATDKRTRPAPSRPSVANGKAWLWAAFFVAVVAVVALAIAEQSGVFDGPTQAPAERPTEPAPVAEQPAAPADGGNLGGRVAALEQRAPAGDEWARRLDEFGDRLERLEAAPAPTDPGPGLARLEERVAALDGRLAELAAQDDGGTGTAVGALEDDVAALEENVQALRRDFAGLREEVSGALEPDRDERAVKSVFLAQRLRREVLAGRPYADALGALGTIAGDDTALHAATGRLDPAAAAGIATVGELAARLDEVGDAVIDAAARGHDDDWIAAALERLRGVVTVRRLDEPPGPDNPGGTVATARDALARGDLDAAIDALSTLTPLDVAALDLWLADARRRRDALAALDDVEQAVADRLAKVPAGE